jgi:cytochrome b561
MVVLILAQIFVGWFMTPYDEAREPLASELYFWHKSFGLLILVLVMLRLAKRLSSSIPALPASLPGRERAAAKAVHRLLYVLMFASPITGYVLSSTYVYSDGVTFFGIEIPEVFPDHDLAFAISDGLHVVFGYTLLAAVILHAAGALKHRFFDKRRENDVLSRIL